MRSVADDGDIKAVGIDESVGNVICERDCQALCSDPVAVADERLGPKGLVHELDVAVGRLDNEILVSMPRALDDGCVKGELHACGTVIAEAPHEVRRIRHDVSAPGGSRRKRKNYEGQSHKVHYTIKRPPSPPPPKGGVFKRTLCLVKCDCSTNSKE